MSRPVLMAWSTDPRPAQPLPQLGEYIEVLGTAMRVVRVAVTLVGDNDYELRDELHAETGDWAVTVELEAGP